MPQMTIKPAFELGKTVYIVTDPCQFEVLVIGYHVFSNGISYIVRHADCEPSIHSYVELSHIKREDVQELPPQEEE